METEVPGYPAVLELSESILGSPLLAMFEEWGPEVVVWPVPEEMPPLLEVPEVPVSPELPSCELSESILGSALLATFDECGPVVVVWPVPEERPLLCVLPRPEPVLVEPTPWVPAVLSVPDGKAPGTRDASLAVVSRVFPKCDPSPATPALVPVGLGVVVCPVPVFSVSWLLLCEL